MLRSEPLEEVPEFRDNGRIRISGVKASETVSTPAPNPVFSATGRTVYADEAGTCKYADQPYNLKDTETLRTPPVNPPVLRTSLRENREKLEMRIRNPPFIFCMELALLGG